jgi:hypothetical protein
VRIVAASGSIGTATATGVVSSETADAQPANNVASASVGVVGR